MQLVIGGTFPGRAQTLQATALKPPIPALALRNGPVTYGGGQLSISVRDISLVEILRNVAAETGATLDIPSSANSEIVPFARIGPAAPRAALSILLNDSNFDYVIQSSDENPEAIKRILLLVREKPTPGPDLARSAAPANPYSRLRSASPPHPIPQPAPPPDLAPQPDSQPEPSANPAATAVSDDPVPDRKLAEPAPQDVARPGVLAPPSSLDPQTISQQLQQMYQQRMQMVKDDRQTGIQPK